MTVCIAAMSILNRGADQIPVIVGAADRLVTYGDTEYEQPDPKILPMASHTVAMISGSPEAHTTIRNRTIRAVNQLTKSPTVELIANTYASEFGNLRSETAEKKFLIPNGLNRETFLANRNLPAEAIHRLMDAMESESLASRAIIAGIDQLGQHIYVVSDPGEATCYDLQGWAAIGSGRRHADLQFIYEKYTASRAFDEAFLLTYLAKKKADITPGVGAETDLFWISTEGYVFLPPTEDIVKVVYGVHAKLDKQEIAQRDKAKGKIHEYVQRQLQKNRAQAGAQQPAASPTAVAEGASDSPEASPHPTLGSRPA